jgi:hypothetical protein
VSSQCGQVGSRVRYEHTCSPCKHDELQALVISCTLLHIRVDNQWPFYELGHQFRLDFTMDLVTVVKVVHVLHRIEDATGHEVVALTALVLVGLVGLGKVDVVLPVLER